MSRLRMKHLLVSVFTFLILNPCIAQFSPQVGSPGSKAISANSPLIKFWATSAFVQRGYINLADTLFTVNGSNRATYGSVQNALGKADNKVISLGDKGYITLSFPVTITNGPGPDFVVFENGFICQNNPKLAFLELAFVEVSTDGIHFVRFPAISLTQDTAQIGPFQCLDARKIHNLAGKYIAMWGTGFDLTDLEDSASAFFDPNQINYVRIIDVGGFINPKFASYDAQHHIINDPFPTPYLSSGFDLDAVGVINFHNKTKKIINIFPNPCNNILFINSKQKILNVKIFSSDGKLVMFYNENSNFIRISVLNFPKGIYFCCIKTLSSEFCQTLIKI